VSGADPTIMLTGPPRPPARRWPRPASRWATSTCGR
jgi:hypothetical protein